MVSDMIKDHLCPREGPAVRTRGGLPSLPFHRNGDPVISWFLKFPQRQCISLLDSEAMRVVDRLALELLVARLGRDLLQFAHSTVLPELINPIEHDLPHKARQPRVELVKQPPRYITAASARVLPQELFVRYTWFTIGMGLRPRLPDHLDTTRLISLLLLLRMTLALKEVSPHRVSASRRARSLWHTSRTTCSVHLALVWQLMVDQVGRNHGALSRRDGSRGSPMRPWRPSLILDTGAASVMCLPEDSRWILMTTMTGLMKTMRPLLSSVGLASYLLWLSLGSTTTPQPIPDFLHRHLSEGNRNFLW